MLSLALAALTVIEVSAHVLAPDERGALESACSRALGAPCSVSEQPLESTSGRLALLSVEGAGRVVHVAVQRHDEPAGRWLRRTLVFAPEDAPTERWRAVGLTIATLAAPLDDPERRRPTPPREPPRSVSSPPQNPDRAVADLQPPGIRLGLGFLAGTGLEEGPWRTGGFARGSVALARSAVEPTAGIAVTVRERTGDGVRAAWLAGSAGVCFGGVIPALDLSLRARIEALIERIEISHDPPDDTGSLWLGGARLGTELMWPARRRVGVLVGAEYWWRTSGTVVLVGEERVGRVPAQAISAGLGLEVRFR